MVVLVTSNVYAFRISSDVMSMSVVVSGVERGGEGEIIVNVGCGGVWKSCTSPLELVHQRSVYMNEKSNFESNNDTYHQLCPGTACGNTFSFYELKWCSTKYQQ